MSSDTRRRAFLLAGSMVATVLLLRLSLWISPNTDFNIGSYNIHHLFTGLLFITLGALPLVLFQGNSRWLDVCVLALGAGLGANFTPVAAAANVYVIGVAERAGYRITFIQFLRYGLLVTMVSLLIATAYVWLRYLL